VPPEGEARADHYDVPVVRFAASSPARRDEGAKLRSGSGRRERWHVADGPWSPAGGWIATP